MTIALLPIVDLKARVLAILEHHQGKANAVKGMELAHLVGLRDDRAVQLAIEELINEGIPVCSSCAVPMGYFLPETVAEADEYKHQLRSRAIGNFHRYKYFKRAFQQWYYGESQRRLL